MVRHDDKESAYNVCEMKQLVLLLTIMLVAGCAASTNAQESTYEAVYLVQENGQFSKADLQAHPEVAVTHSFDDFKRFAKKKIALWIDINAVGLIYTDWLNQKPQRFYPIVLIGSSDALCAFRDLLGGFGVIEGPYADCSSPPPGFSVWMLKTDTDAGSSAFMHGYEQTPIVKDILEITNPLLEDKEHNDQKLLIREDKHMIDPDLEDKVVLVTGANHGIGASIARAFAAQRAKLFITFYRNPSRYSEEELEQAKRSGIGGDIFYRAMQQQSADPLLESIRAQGGVAIAKEADLSDPNTIPLLFDLCESQLGSVDILVNNHTHCVLETFDPSLATEEGDIQLITAEGIDHHFAINTRAYALMMAEYLRRYLKRRAVTGRIINISTDAAHAHTANVNYAASKHAIESYSRSAAAELGKYGITVNIVAPGPIQTGWLPPNEMEEIASQTPLRRVGKPEDIADVVVFLASEQARWMTGQLLYVGGGWRMHQ